MTKWGKRGERGEKVKYRTMNKKNFPRGDCDSFANNLLRIFMERGCAAQAVGKECETSCGFVYAYAYAYA